MKEIRLTVKDIDDSNRRVKYLTACDSLAKAMNVPMTLRRKDDEHAEKYPYQAYQDLVQKWTFYYAGMMDRVYWTVCHVFDLPMVTTFSKAIDTDPLIHRGKVLYSPESGKPITQKQWRDFVRVMERFLNRGMQEPEKRIVLDAVALGRVLDRMLKFNTWETVESVRLADLEYRNHKFAWLSDELNLSRAFGMTDFQAARLHVAEDCAAQYVRSMADKSRLAVNQAILSGIKERKSKSEVAQDLFDRMGDLNRDWQRIVETEVGDNMNSAFLLAQKESAEPGEKVYFQRFEIRDDATCKHCDRIRGLVVLWSDVPLKDEKIDDQYARIAIWEGKTRVGRKAADEWVASGTQHPWCRGSWARWFTTTKKTGGMYDAAMAKLKGRQRAWGEAVFKAEAEFKAKGIEKPNDTTPGYLERINELYRG